MKVSQKNWSGATRWFRPYKPEGFTSNRNFDFSLAGCQFERCGTEKEDAERFLADRNYFFKLKAFAKNYNKRFAGGDAKGRYIGLDFAYLVELSRIDKQLRDLVLDLTLDIEHYLKVRINRSALSTTLSCCCRILQISFARSNSCQRAYRCAGGRRRIFALSFTAVAK